MRILPAERPGDQGRIVGASRKHPGQDQLGGGRLGDVCAGGGAADEPRRVAGTHPGGDGQGPSPGAGDSRARRGGERRVANPLDPARHQPYRRRDSKRHRRDEELPAAYAEATGAPVRGDTYAWHVAAALVGWQADAALQVLAPQADVLTATLINTAIVVLYEGARAATLTAFVG